MNKSLYILLSISLFTAVSCLNKETQEAEVMTPQTDITSVHISADFLSEGGDCTKTVRIRSNRSWTAHLNDENHSFGFDESVPWASLDKAGHINVQGSTEETDLVITFLPNVLQEDIKGVLELFCDGKKCKEISILQDAIIPRLNVSAEKTEASADGETISVYVDCNVNWTVRVAETSSAETRLKQNGGYLIDTLSFRILENDDPEAKSATLLFSADGCPDTSVAFTQAAYSGGLKTWEIIPKFEDRGSGTGHYPVVVIDTLSTGNEILSSGAKFYYTLSGESFDDAGMPTVENDLLDENGVDFLTRTRVSFTQAYLVILGTCPGCRNTYAHILLRNWQFGTKFILSSDYGLTLSAKPSSKSTNYIYWDKNLKLSTTQVETGNGNMYFLIHNGANTPTCNFSVGGKLVSSWPLTTKNTYTSTEPGGLVSSPYHAEAGTDIEFIPLNAKGLLWQFTLLEEKKYKY